MQKDDVSDKAIVQKRFKYTKLSSLRFSTLCVGLCFGECTTAHTMSKHILKNWLFFEVGPFFELPRPD